MSADHHGARVLVLEDEWIVAEMVRAMLVEAGYQVAGPVNSVARALQAIERDPVDAAVCDIWLGEETSFPFAEALADRGTPFLFTTGYAAADIPERFRRETLIGKPIEPAALLSALRTLLA